MLLIYVKTLHFKMMIIIVKHLYKYHDIVKMLSIFYNCSFVAYFISDIYVLEPDQFIGDYFINLSHKAYPPNTSTVTIMINIIIEVIDNCSKLYKGISF